MKKVYLKESDKETITEAIVNYYVDYVCDMFEETKVDANTLKDAERLGNKLDNLIKKVWLLKK